MSYTLNEMFDLMDIEIHDESGNVFADKLKLSWLNSAQDHMLSRVNGQYVTELHELDAAETPTTGVYATSGLTYSIYRKHLGIMGVKVAGGVFCDYITFEQYKRYVSDGYTFVATAPKYYTRKASVYLYPTSIASIDVYYMREPVDMVQDVASGSIADGKTYTVNNYTTVVYPKTTGTTYTDGESFTGSTSDGTDYDVTGTGTVTVDCELEDEIQEMILDYAKHLACLTQRDATNSAINKANAYERADIINHKVDMERSSYRDSSRTAWTSYERDPLTGGGDR